MNKKKKNFRTKPKKLTKKIKRGSGIIDKIIDKLPLELHIPGYQYCGPGDDENHIIEMLRALKI